MVLIQKLNFENVVWKCRPFCISLNVLDSLHFPTDLKTSTRASVFISSDNKVQEEGGRLHNQALFTWRFSSSGSTLTQWGRVTHICVGNLTIIGSDNGWSPGRHQAITWTNVGILLIGPLGTNFSEMLIEIYTFSSRKSIWKCRLENGGHFVSASMC